jgi:hypothetical protein
MSVSKLRESREFCKNEDCPGTREIQEVTKKVTEKPINSINFHPINHGDPQTRP